jgi:hypothetical protein
VYTRTYLCHWRDRPELLARLHVVVAESLLPGGTPAILPLQVPGAPCSRTVGACLLWAC